MSGNLFDWSTTASSNDSADGDINWTEGQNAKTVNNSARQMMGRVPEYRDDQGGLVTIGGTANAITATLNSSFTTLADGRHFTLQPTSDNTGAVTLNVNGIGAKAIRKFDSTGEVALNSGDLQAGAFYHLIYDSSANSAAGAWIVLNPTAQPQNSKLTDIAALTPTDGNIIVGDGTTWVAESGSTARESIGAVGGPASAVDSNFVAFDSTTGKLIKDSGKSSASFATAAQGTKADGATQATDLASTSASKGASLVGVQDSGGNFTATTVEAVLAEIATDIDAKAPNPTTSSSSSLTDYPIGETIWVNTPLGAPVRNSTQTIYLDGTTGFKDSGTTSLAGTWRARGAINNAGSIQTLFVRVA